MQQPPGGERPRRKGGMRQESLLHPTTKALADEHDCSANDGSGNEDCHSRVVLAGCSSDDVRRVS